MYLIYVLAKTTSPKATKQGDIDLLPDQDLKPVMVAINRCENEFFVREHDSRRAGAKQDDAYAHISRIFCRLREHEGEIPKCEEDPASAVEGGRAQLAVALATIFFKPNDSEPIAGDFVEHVMDRTRLADKIAIVGYTGDALSMRKSEVLGLERARTVRNMLKAGGVKCRMIAMARPKCNYAKRMRLSHRVEIVAIFLGKEEKCEAPSRKVTKKRKNAVPKAGKGKRGESISIISKELN